MKGDESYTVDDYIAFINELVAELNKAERIAKRMAEDKADAVFDRGEPGY